MKFGTGTEQTKILRNSFADSGKFDPYLNYDDFFGVLDMIKDCHN